MLDAESEENCMFMGGIGLKRNGLQRAFDKIKFANCSVIVNAVSKEHGILRRSLKDYLIFSSIKTFSFQRLALLPVGWHYYLKGGVITYLPSGVITFTCF